MTAIIRPRPWVQQPQFVTGFNLENQIGRKTIAFYTPPITGSAITPANTIKGKAFGFSGSSSINAGAVASAGRFTVVSGLIVSDGQDTDGAGEYIFGSNFNGASEPFVFRLSPSRQIYTGCYSYAGDTGSVTHGVSLDIDKYVVAYARVGAANAYDTWSSGVIVEGSISDSSTTFTSSTRAGVNMYIGSGANSGSLWRYYSKPIVWLALVDGHLSSAELLSMGANPWQVFRPRVT